MLQCKPQTANEIQTDQHIYTMSHHMVVWPLLCLLLSGLCACLYILTIAKLRAWSYFHSDWIACNQPKWQIHPKWHFIYFSFMWHNEIGCNSIIQSSSKLEHEYSQIVPQWMQEKEGGGWTVLGMSRQRGGEKNCEGEEEDGEELETKIEDKRNKGANEKELISYVHCNKSNKCVWIMWYELFNVS